MSNLSNFLLSRIRGVGDRNSRYVFSTAFGSVVESYVAFLQVNRLKNNPGEITLRQVKDSLKSLLFIWQMGAQPEAQCCCCYILPRLVLLMVFMSVLSNGLERAVCKGLKASSGFGYCGGQV